MQNRTFEVELPGNRSTWQVDGSHISVEDGTLKIFSGFSLTAVFANGFWNSVTELKNSG